MGLAHQRAHGLARSDVHKSVKQQTGHRQPYENSPQVRCDVSSDVPGVFRNICVRVKRALCCWCSGLDPLIILLVHCVQFCFGWFWEDLPTVGTGGVSVAHVRIAVGTDVPVKRGVKFLSVMLWTS